MTTRSMTGYALHPFEIGKSHWKAELKSVNHRFLEASVRTPAILFPYEQEIRKLISEKISRGKVQLFLSCESKGTNIPVFNPEAVKGVITSLRRIKKTFDLAGDVVPGDLLRIPGVFQQEESKSLSKQEWTALSKAIEVALEKFLKAKEKEGAVLAAEILGRLKNMRKILNEIGSEKERIFLTQRETYRTKLKTLVADIPVDEERIAKEVAVMLERWDVTEEIVRLGAHINLFEKTLRDNVICGKDLDFILQEMNRETNTISSKIQNSVIMHAAIAMKSDIEKIREQVQNIE